MRVNLLWSGGIVEINIDRTIPCNLDVEKHILGYILVSGKCTAELEPEDFYLDSHRKIYRCMMEMTDAGQDPDLVSLVHSLRAKDELETCGGASYLAALSDGVPNYHEGLAEQYYSIVREQRALRTGIQVATTMIDGCYNQDNFRDVVNNAFEKLDIELGRIERKSGPRLLSEIVSLTYTEIEHIVAHETGAGYKFGFIDLDNFIPRGLQTKEYTVIAGRPGQGKSSLLMNVAKNIGLQKVPVIIFSLEMSQLMVVMRMIAEAGRVPLSRIMTGFLSKSDWEKIHHACDILSALPIWIDDSTNLTVADMRSRCRRLSVKPKVVGVDYLQLIQCPKFLLNRPDVEKVSYNSISMKNMAKNLDMAAIVASQLSRESEKRKDHRPQMSDLRQSGQIEQDADLALLLYREQKEGEEDLGTSEIIVGKQRNGATGTVKMHFSGEFSCFDPLDQNYDPSSEYYQSKPQLEIQGLDKEYNPYSDS